MKKQELTTVLTDLEVELSEDAIDKLSRAINKSINDIVAPKDAKIKEQETTLDETLTTLTELQSAEVVDKVEYDKLVDELNTKTADFQELETVTMLQQAGFAEDDMDFVRTLLDASLERGEQQEDILAKLQERFNTSMPTVVETDPQTPPTVPTVDGLADNNDALTALESAFDKL